MEKKILPKPAVAGILNENYIEARLHTDRDSVPQLAQILEGVRTGDHPEVEHEAEGYGHQRPGEKSRR